MYAVDDGEVRVELGYLGKTISAAKAAEPDHSKTGGTAAWYGDPPLSSDDLLCGLCGRALLLVAQVNAPTHFPRSLCIFGCNRAICSTRPQGWRVIRTQQNRQAEPSGRSTELASAGCQTGAVAWGDPTTISPQDNMPQVGAWDADGASWDDKSCEEDDWGSGVGDWGASDACAGDGVDTGRVPSMPEIDALLEEQELRSRQRLDELTTVGSLRRDERHGGRGAAALGGSSSKDVLSDGEVRGSKSKRSARSVKTAGRTTSLSFPARLVHFSSEPWEAQGAGDEDEEMERRIRRYREEEDDKGLVAALDKALGVKDTKQAAKPSASGDGTVLSATAGEKYERTPARAKAVLRFAERVARAPWQVIRYAYDGEPLWSASDPPKAEVPPCVCGAARVFEFQLMPALLLELQVNAFAVPGDVEAREGVGADGDASHSRAKGESKAPRCASESAAANTPCSEAVEHANKCDEVDVASNDASGDEVEQVPLPSAEDRERLRTWGMDWGVVTVWCCPKSCELSFEEAVLIQEAV